MQETVSDFLSKEGNLSFGAIITWNRAKWS